MHHDRIHSVAGILLPLTLSQLKLLGRIYSFANILNFSNRHMILIECSSFQQIIRYIQTDAVCQFFGASRYLMCRRGSPSFGSGHSRCLFTASLSIIAWVICSSVIPERRCASHSRNCISAHSLRSSGSAAVSSASLLRCSVGQRGRRCRKLPATTRHARCVPGHVPALAVGWRRLA